MVCRKCELFTTSRKGTSATGYREIGGQFCDFSLMFYRCARSCLETAEWIYMRPFLSTLRLYR